MTNQNVEIIEMTDGMGNPKTVVKIQSGEDAFTWMDKSTYDAQVEHLTEKVTDEANTL